MECCEQIGFLMYSLESFEVGLEIFNNIV